MAYRVRGFYSQVIEITYSTNSTNGPLNDGLVPFLQGIEADMLLAAFCTHLTNMHSADPTLDALVPEVQTEAAVFIRVECPMRVAHMVVNDLVKLAETTFGPG